MVDRDYMRGDYGGSGGGGFQLALPRMTPVVKWIMILNLVGFVLRFIDPVTITAFGGLNPAHPLLFPLQAFTYQFLHDVEGLGHILFNMLALYFFGTSLESRVGRARFLRIYLGSGVAGAVVYLLWCLVRGGGRPCIGASGAVSGVVLYFCAAQPRATILLFFVPVRAWVIGAGLVVIAAYSMLSELRFHVAGGTAHSAHLGGALMGLFLFRSRSFLRRWTEEWDRRRRLRQREDRARDQALMDKLLEKVGREGLGSLTEKERRFMQEMSRRLKGR